MLSCRPNLSDVNSNRAVVGRDKNKVTYNTARIIIMLYYVRLYIAREKRTVHYNIIMYL